MILTRISCKKKTSGLIKAGSVAYKGSKFQKLFSNDFTNVASFTYIYSRLCPREVGRDDESSLRDPDTLNQSHLHLKWI